MFVNIRKFYVDLKNLNTKNIYDIAWLIGLFKSFTIFVEKDKTIWIYVTLKSLWKDREKERYKLNSREPSQRDQKPASQCIEIFRENPSLIRNYENNINFQQQQVHYVFLRFDFKLKLDLALKSLCLQRPYKKVIIVYVQYGKLHEPR
jgi:hypothetical protein